jgi:hypothetical protein
MYHYDYDDEENAPRLRWAIGLVALMAVGGWFGYQRLTGDTQATSGPEALPLDPPTAPTLPTIPESSMPESTDVETTMATRAAIMPSKSPPRPTTTSIVPTTTTAVPTTTSTVPTTTSTVPTTTSTVPTTTSTVTTTALTAVTAAPIDPRSLLPDGTVVSALVTFDPEVITVTGTVSSHGVVEGLLDFVASADAVGRPIRNEVTVDPSAPGADSVRFVGLDPLPYPEGTADIRPEHAAELDRIATLLGAFPDVTVVVVGRADQRGPAERNLGIAARRAEATIEYLVSHGIEPARLTALAIGESQLTSSADAEEAYALNRRVEFVVDGLGG